MNDREASKRPFLEEFSFIWLGDMGGWRKFRSGPQKPLKGYFTDYLTDLEGSTCEILDHTDINVMPFKWQGKDYRLNKLIKERDELLKQDEFIAKGVDLDQFKRDCEVIDNE